MKRIAAPMMDGVVSSTVLTLLVVTAIWSLDKQRELRRAARVSPRESVPAIDAAGVRGAHV